MSLRTRLLAGMFFLVSVALVVAAAAIYEQQRSFLLNHSISERSRPPRRSRTSSEWTPEH
ncbi:MAG: hypothetical protein ACXVUE_13710 [Solirubrobacteraceae bacterium]